MSEEQQAGREGHPADERSREDHGELVMVPSRFDEWGEPVDWVWVRPEHTAHWDARNWRPHP